MWDDADMKWWIWTVTLGALLAVLGLGLLDSSPDGGSAAVLLAGLVIAAIGLGMRRTSRRPRPGA